MDVEVRVVKWVRLVMGPWGEVSRGRAVSHQASQHSTAGTGHSAERIKHQTAPCILDNITIGIPPIPIAIAIPKWLEASHAISGEAPIMRGINPDSRLSRSSRDTSNWTFTITIHGMFTCAHSHTWDMNMTALSIDRATGVGRHVSRLWDWIHNAPVLLKTYVFNNGRCLNICLNNLVCLNNVFKHKTYVLKIYFS